jgi:RNase P/RNase MRP subunit POP5
VTLAKKKFRYACIYLQNDDDQDAGGGGGELVYSSFLRDFNKRLFELCGSIDFHKSNLRIINVGNVSKKFIIIKCKLDYIDNVLLSLCFTDYPILLLPVSGTIKQLKRRIQEFLKHADFLINS